MMQSERLLLQNQQTRDQNLLLILGAAALLGYGVPVALSDALPKALKTLMVTTGVAASVAGASIAGSSASERRIRYTQIIQKHREEALKKDLKLQTEIANDARAWQLVRQQASTKAQVLRQILQDLRQHPVEMQCHILQELDLTGLLPTEQLQSMIGELQPQTVETVAVPVQPQEQVQYATPQPVPTQGVVSNPFANKFAVSQDDFFPTEDIAALVAQMTTDPGVSGSILAACPRGTGKSNFLNACIPAANDINGGAIDFNVFNAKFLEEGKNLAGLEKSDQDYLVCTVDNIPELYRRLHALDKTLDTDPEFPTLNLIDEWNNTLLNAEAYDSRGLGGKIKYQKELRYFAYRHITMGRSKRFMSLITSHSPYVEDLGMNGAIRENLNFVMLSRGERTSAITKALDGKRQLIDNIPLRERLYEQFMEYLNSKQFSPEKIVALTNLLGDWRLVFLPYYPDIQPDIKRGILNQSASEIFDTQLLDIEPQKSDDPYAYRYPPQWQVIAQLSKVLSKGKCCYPGCQSDAVEVHHSRYMDERGNSICENPQPGVDVFPLCSEHHGKDDPNAAHHPSNWIKGTIKEPLQIDSANTTQYRAMLIQGFQEKASGK